MIYPDADPREGDLYRAQLNRFSEPTFNPSEFALRLERDRQWYANEYPFAYHYARRVPRPVDEPRLKELVVATQSMEKRAVVQRVARALGFSTIFVPAVEAEEAIQARMRRLIQFPTKHSLHVAGGKLGYNEPGCPALALDTVLEAGDAVFYKPTSIDEARDMIWSASEGPITIHVGTMLNLPTRQGRLLELGTQVSIRLKLRRISDVEIEHYLTTQPDLALGTVGAIDYKDPFVQPWIDSSEPVTITCASNLIWPGPLQISIRALPGLKTYFAGAPEEPLRGILSCVVPLAEAL